MNEFFDLENLERFYSEHPDSLIFAQLASRYIESGQVENGISVAREGVSRHGDYAFGHFILGWAYLQSSQFDLARGSLEASVALDDKNPRAWRLLGELNAREDRTVQSRDSYLHYFLLDAFNSEAVEKFQEEESFQFDELGGDEGFAVAEPADEDKTVILPTRDESAADLDALFEDHGDVAEDVDISEKVEEVFKETLGDLGIDSSDIRETTGEADTTEDTLDVLDFDMEPDPVPLADPDESDDIDPASLISEFDEPDTREDTAGVVAEEAAAAIDTESDSEVLSFSALVEEIISDKSAEEAAAPVAEDDDTQGDTREETLETTGDDTLEDTLEETLGEGLEAAAQTADAVQDGEAATTFKLPESRSPAAGAPRPTSKFGTPPILSPTLGEIYIAQGRFEEAIKVFEQLLEKDPGNHRFQKKIEDVRKMLEKSRN